MKEIEEFFVITISRPGGQHQTKGKNVAREDAGVFPQDLAVMFST